MGHNHGNHAVFSLRIHLVFVCKYRRKALDAEMLGFLRERFAFLLASWKCRLMEFGGESDHVHLLVDFHPAVDLSKLVCFLKSQSSRSLRSAYADRLRKHYRKNVLWTGAYFAATCGGAPLAKIAEYVKSQGLD
jgi:putative transposase